MTRQIAGMAAVAAALASTTPAASGDGDILVLATGGEAGVYFPLGAALAELWSTRLGGLDVVAEPTGGSVTNVALVEEGEAKLAFVQNDIARYAFAGEEMFTAETTHGSLRGMALLYPEPIQIVTLEASGIAAVDALEGRRVAVGARGSGTEVNARQVLEAHGLDYDSVAASYLDFAEAAVALRDGIIHAAFVTAGIPTRAVAELVEIHGQSVALVPLDGQSVEALVERWPYYAPATVPAGTYGLASDVTTVTVHAMLVAREDLPAEAVEAMLDALYDPETLQRLCGIHPRGCDIARETAIEAMPIPLHPGAEAFFAR